jgi:hypothetical protein
MAAIVAHQNAGMPCHDGRRRKSRHPLSIISPANLCLQRLERVDDSHPENSNEATSLERSTTLPLWQRQTKPMAIRCPPIALCRTCNDCHETKMATYRPEVLNDPNYQSDEPIDDD